jgi:hypothetical protein
MSTPPPSPDDPSSRYSFDDPPRQQQPQQTYNNPTAWEENPLIYNHPRYNPQDFSVQEEVIDAVDDTFGISNRLLGCAWWSITLPFRMIGKIFDVIGDLF